MATQPAQKASKCPFHVGMDSHVGPYAGPDGVIVQQTSDAMFGPEGLGFAGTFWMTLVSWLARNGISEQTGSRPNETIAKNCVAGWGQGAFSSRVFLADGTGGWDDAQLVRLIEHLGGIAQKLEGDATRVNSATVAAFVGSQEPRPYQTYTGIREVHGFVAENESRFRGHIQWQAFVALCGYVNTKGERVVTPSLLNRFFAGETSFFLQLVEHRRELREGEIQPGALGGFLGEVEPYIDREATDRAYMAKKSGLWLVLKIAYYMVTRKGSGLAPLH
jgi:hypothetical protein